MSRRYITTGPPGSGKSTALALLEDTVEVVPEAATDVVATMLEEGIGQPELDRGFLPRIVALQRRRRLAATSELQVHDRSIFCTLALARFLDLPLPAALRAEAEECAGWYEPEGLLRPSARLDHAHPAAADQLRGRAAVRRPASSRVCRARVLADRRPGHVGVVACEVHLPSDRRGHLLRVHPMVPRRSEGTAARLLGHRSRALRPSA